MNESYVNPGNEVLVRAIGKVKPGDVVYRRDGQYTIILRWAYLSLFLVAIGSEPEQISRWSLQPSRLTDDDFLDKLYIDYSYLEDVVCSLGRDSDCNNISNALLFKAMWGLYSKSVKNDEWEEQP